jgi:hypothetical protein
MTNKMSERRTGRILISTGCAAAMFCGMISAVLADTVTLSPVADTTMFRDASLTSGELSSGAGDALFSGRTSIDSNTVQRAMLRFDLAGIPAGSVVTSAELTLTVVRAPFGSQATPIAVHRLTASWGEGTSVAFGGSGVPSETGDADWASRFHPDTAWTTPGGDFAAAASGVLSVAADRAAVTWPSSSGMVADVQAWVNNGDTNFGWILINNEALTSTTRKFGSREAFETASRPVLVVTFSASGPSCLADLAIDGQPDGTVDGSDFIAFVNSFAIGDASVDPLADVAGGGDDGLAPDGTVDGSDFIAFINAFAVGC